MRPRKSLEVAKKHVYLYGKFEGSAKMGSAKAVADDYVKTMQPIAERRQCSRVIDWQRCAETSHVGQLPA